MKIDFTRASNKTGVKNPQDKLGLINQVCANREHPDLPGPRRLVWLQEAW